MSEAPPPTPFVDAATHAAVAELLATVESRWRTLDLAALESLWDTSRAPLYIAEEAGEVHTSFEAIRGYWAFTRSIIEKMDLRLGRPDLVPLGADLLTAVYPLHWECLIKGQKAPVGGDNRACAVLRRIGGSWRFTQYIEAPLAPIVYMRQLYEQTVRPGFGTAAEIRGGHAGSAREG
jgi:hypothetical protein